MEAVAPYTRFVRAEHEKLTALDKELAEIGASLGADQNRNRSRRRLSDLGPRSNLRRVRRSCVRASQLLPLSAPPRDSR